MCGRTCLTLEPNEIRCACKYTTIANNKNEPNKNNDKNTDKKDVANNEVLKMMPEWRSEYNLGKKYQPSYNISPTCITPVLVSTKHFELKNDDTEQRNTKDNEQKQTRILVPMMWSMIPFWHKGDYKKHGLTTNNCRLEHMLESKLYRRPFNKGQRCVVVCEGFYEWQTTKSAKPSERNVYFIHMPQDDSIKIHDKNTWKDNTENLKLLKMAGLFDIWEDENGDKMYSYSIITHESGDTLSWLHHRMPAILETDEEVADWLDFDRVNDQQALKLLNVKKMKLLWYEISNIVNNVRNQSEQCNKPIESIKNGNGSGSSIVPKSKIMQSWLIIRKRKEDNLEKKFATESDDEDDLIDMPKQKYPKLRGKSGGSETLTSTTGTGTETESDGKFIKTEPKEIEIKKEV